MRRSRNLKLLTSGIILAILGLVVWWISDRVIWLGDDLDYKYQMKGAIWQSWGEICSWNDYWRSQYVHYLNVNGRYVAHALVQLMNGILGQHIFAIFNAAIYICFAVMIAKVSKVKISGNPGGILTIVCLAVICFPTKMMPTCQIGYIWGMTMNLIWLNLFFSGRKLTAIKVIGMTALGILAGNWQESISVGISGALGIAYLYQLMGRGESFVKRIDGRRLTIMIGYVVGTAINCFSPATITRAHGASLPISDQLLYASFSTTGILLLAMVLVYFKLRHRHIDLHFNIDLHSRRIPDGILIMAICILVLFNVAVGIICNRQLFGANLFAIILLLRVLPRHRFSTFMNIAASIGVIAIWTMMIMGVNNVRRQYDDITKQFTEAKDGKVYCDRVRVMTTGHPSWASYYADILGQFDNDIHHSLMKDFKHKRGGKPMKLLPTTIPDTVKTEQYAPGHFYVTVEEPKKGAPQKEITIHGHYSILGIINIPAEERKLQISKYSRRMPPYATAVVIPEWPLFKADSISI